MGSGRRKKVYERGGNNTMKQINVVLVDKKLENQNFTDRSSIIKLEV